MAIGSRGPAPDRVRSSKADVLEPSAGREIIGRRRIAFAAHKSERTISRMVARGTLPATRSGGPNRPMSVRAADLRKLR